MANVQKIRKEMVSMKKLTLILTFLLLWTVVCGPSTAQADIPHLISYQGRLTDTSGNAVLNGSYNIKFSIYSSEAGGAPLWFNTRSVTVEDGIFDVLLGEAKTLDLPFDAQYYLGIQVGTEQEMTPRQKLASVGYAYMAEKAEQADNATSATESTNADTVDGIHASTTPEAGKLVALDENIQIPKEVVGGYMYITFTPGVCLDTESEEKIHSNDGLIANHQSVMWSNAHETLYFSLAMPQTILSKPVIMVECTIYYSTSSATQAKFSEISLYEVIWQAGSSVKASQTYIGQNQTGDATIEIINAPFTVNPTAKYYLKVAGATSSAGASLHMIRVKLSY